MNKVLRRSLTVGVLSCLTLVGCSAQPENLQDLEPSQAKQEHLDQLQSWIFPPAEAEEARKKFVQRCVASRNGGVYEEATIARSLSIAPPGGLTTAELKEFGYVPGANAKSSYTPVKNGPKGVEAYFGNTENGSVSVTFLEYSTGDVAIDGCMAESYQYIYGTVEDGLKAALIAPSFANSVADEVRSDEAFSQLQQEWSTCMSEQGYADLTDVVEARDLAMHASKEEAQEITNKDISCREKVEYDTKFSDIEKAYYETVYQRVKKFGEELTAIHQKAQENVAQDRQNPQDSSTITVETPSPTESS